MEDKKKILILISQEGEKEEISEKAANRSKLIQIMREINPDCIEIPLSLKINILKKIKEFLEHYENEDPIEIERPLPSNDFKLYVNEWDYNYTDVDIHTIMDLIVAANYMDIKELLELWSAKFASIMKRNSTEEIRKDYNITTDYTPEEEQFILEENKWAFENL